LQLTVRSPEGAALNKAAACSNKNSKAGLRLLL